jgi:hypothetical protein
MSADAVEDVAQVNQVFAGVSARMSFAKLTSRPSRLPAIGLIRGDQRGT